MSCVRVGLTDGIGYTQFDGESKETSFLGDTQGEVTIRQSLFVGRYGKTIRSDRCLWGSGALQGSRIVCWL